MIRAIAKSNKGRRLLLLGLSEENIKRLKQGKVIHTDCLDLGVNVDVVIDYGSTEQEIAERWQESMSTVKREGEAKSATEGDTKGKDG